MPDEASIERPAPPVRPPVEPPSTRWRLPPAEHADRDGVVGVGGDLEPGTLLAGYRNGLFPMPHGARRLIWFSPDPRAVMPFVDVHVSRSLRRAQRRFRVTRDVAFREVMTACADPARPFGWINAAFIDAYTTLHQLGWARSFEVWDDDDNLVGGLYGVHIGGFFAGESMFHTATDASKVALVAAREWLASIDGWLFDVQWMTPHLQSLGAITMPRSKYLAELKRAIER